LLKTQKVETILDSSEIFTFQSSITALALLNFLSIIYNFCIF